MRLLHARTHTFKEFLGEPPEYAIVSHRWSEEELSHQDFLDGKREGYGWVKIAKACELAYSDYIHWIWNDTICIDKKSSAELSEAINSMYDWYTHATVCYAFLPDVISASKCRHERCLERLEDDESGPCLRAFHKSVWFTRAWTLQELLAPSEIQFFDEDFSWIGSRRTLSDPLTDATSIPEEVLRWNGNLWSFSVAQKMSWAAKRESTRGEDIAYSLMGLFNVNMPLLYGEGAIEAFLRLQTELIRKSSDETIFCWKQTDKLPGTWCRLLAPSPACFAHASGIIDTACFGHTHTEGDPGNYSRGHFQATNLGLHFSFPCDLSARTIAQMAVDNAQMKIILPFNASRECSEDTQMTQGVYLRINHANDRYLMASRHGDATICDIPADLDRVQSPREDWLLIIPSEKDGNARQLDIYIKP